MTDIEPKPRKKSAPVDPMAEENFPDNPTRRAADREMHESSNLRSSSSPTPKRDPRTHEAGEEE